MPGNATVYIADPSMLGSRVFDTLESIQAYEGISEGSEAKGFVLRFPWGECQCNIMAAEDLPEHLGGFENYVRSQSVGSDSLVYAISRLSNVRMCIGLVITHDQEREEEVLGVLFNLNASLNGLLFLYDTVWDWSGEALCGPLKDG